MRHKNESDKDGFAQCWSILFEGIGGQPGLDFRENFRFLKNLLPRSCNVINFGCSARWDSYDGYQGGNEPFALLWTLKAEKVVVVDRNKKSIAVLQKHALELEEKYPQCFEGRKDCFEYLVADMTNAKEMGQLPEKHFELGYCSRVLVGIEHIDGLDGVRKAVREMARVLMPNGWVVSHEAVALELYPTRFISIFTQNGFDKPKIIRQPECIRTPDLQIEYAIYKRLA